MGAFGTHFDMFWGSNLITNGWVQSWGEYQINQTFGGKMANSKSNMWVEILCVFQIHPLPVCFQCA